MVNYGTDRILGQIVADDILKSQDKRIGKFQSACGL